MPSPTFPQELKVLALEKLREFETGFLSDSVHGYNNPFRRPGLTASDIAYACGLVKDEATKYGRAKADVAAARRLLKELIQDEKVESTGKHRTMQCGSQGKECFAPYGFTERLTEKRTPC
jgi:hypothetical protein